MHRTAVVDYRYENIFIFYLLLVLEFICSAPVMALSILSKETLSHNIPHSLCLSLLN